MMQKNDQCPKQKGERRLVPTEEDLDHSKVVWWTLRDHVW
jgi:hypothetical protein